jgi:hypothetical protein
MASEMADGFEPPSGSMRPPPGPSSSALLRIAELEEERAALMGALQQSAEEKATALRERDEARAVPAIVALHDRLATLQRRNEELYAELGRAQGRDMSPDHSQPDRRGGTP